MSCASRTRSCSNSWSNLFVAAIAALFLGALWTVLGLWGALFGLVKIDWFQDLFAQPCSPGGSAGPPRPWARGSGRRMRESSRCCCAAHHPALAHHGAAAPPPVAVLFLGSLVFTGLSPLPEQEYASGLVLGWLALHVLFLNAAFQDGQRACAAVACAPCGCWRLRRRRSLPGVGAIAVYGLGLRIEQHGLSPLRFGAPCSPASHCASASATRCPSCDAGEAGCTRFPR